MNLTIGFKDILLASPLIALCLVAIIPILFKVVRGNREMPYVATLAIAFGGIFISSVLLAIFCSGHTTAFAQSLVFDGITMWGGLLAMASMAAALLVMFDSPATRGPQFSELSFFSLITLAGMLILVSANDLLSVFIGLETMSLPLYVMIAISKEQVLAKESAFKYFILGSFASAIFLFGISFIFGTAGTTYLSEILAKNAELLGSSKLYVVGVVLVSLGFCFKVSIFPFHAWTPDVYQGAPTSHTAFMSTSIKIVSFLAFLRLVLAVPLESSASVASNLLDLFQWLAVLTMLVGNVAACLQNNMKRMLAYSSIAHSGYIMVGLISAGVSETPSFGSTAMIFYFLSYAVMTLGSFAIVAALEKDENHELTVQELAGLPKKRPLLALSLLVFMLSLAGIPPMLGFFGKFYVFTSAIEQGLIWLAIWGVINSVISVYYYLRPVVIMFMVEGEADQAPRQLIATKTAIYTAAVLVIVLGIISGPIFKEIEASLIVPAQVSQNK